jgi:hypothetical protein
MIKMQSVLNVWDIHKESTHFVGVQTLQEIMSGNESPVLNLMGVGITFN